MFRIDIFKNQERGIKMEELKLNETPVRTARNYNINNIKLKNIKIPNVIEKFENVIINKESEKDIINFNISDISLKYGLGDYLLEQVKESSNKKIRININSKTNKNIEIKFIFDKENINLIENIEIIANEDTKSNILIKYEAKENLEFYHNGVIRLNLKENSNVNLTIVNLLNTSSNNFISIENKIEENAKCECCIIDFGGKVSVTNYYSNLAGNNSENNIYTIYLGKESQWFDLNYIVDLEGEKSNTNIEVQGALADNAVKHFKGTINFKRGCKMARGNENECCMLLSDSAKSVALPMLLCEEEEVEGNHSTSSGRADASQVFYIMSRGFSYKEAMKLIVKAKFNNIIERIYDEDLKSEIFNEIEQKLS